ncbi:MAG: radical SAM family heme chaperone HemW [Phycisphaerae bacterium]|nr:radical SAM family heme chaperone HemW [Phycisphaerae bacterium]
MLAVGLYVHIPFCSRKCAYCDFYSRVPGPGQTRLVVDALLAELDSGRAGRCPSVRVQTIFVGGGTPTVLPTDDFGRLFRSLGRLARRDAAVEFTVEANPASVDDAKAAVLRAAGVDRISLGVQSFHVAELACLDRLHSPEDIPRTLRRLRRAGFEHVNLDLIFGIPGQSLASWTDTLRRAVDLEPDHLACYGLTYEPGTPLEARRSLGHVQPCGEALEVEMYARAIDYLAEAGFEHYEISNFARASGRCRHNLGYWLGEPYLGIGPAAAGYLDGQRTRNVADMTEYMRRILAGESAVVEREQLDALAHAGEAAMLELRLIDGLDRERFQRRTGFDPVRLFAEPLASHGVGGRVVVTGSHIRLTRAGLFVADSVMADFIAAAEVSPLAPERPATGTELHGT